MTSANTRQSISMTSELFMYGVNKLLNVVDLFEVTDIDKYIITVKINRKPQYFEVYSGAKYSLLPREK